MRRSHNYMLRFMGYNLTYWGLCTSKYAPWNENPVRLRG